MVRALLSFLSLTGRVAFPEARLTEIVRARRGRGAKLREAFNLCDGTRTQAEVAKAMKMDSGSFSRTVSRWIKAGILFRIGDGREAKLLHVYALTSNDAAKEKTRPDARPAKKGRSRR